MRQKRKGFMLKSVSWIVLLGVAGAGTVYGLSAAGFIKWNPEKKLESLMFWKQAEASANQTAGKQPEKTAPAPANINNNATPQPSSQPSPTPAPSNNTTTKTPAASGLQIVSQAQSIVPVNANVKAWLELAASIKLDPGKLFSFNTWLAEVSKSKVPDKKEDELSHVASLLYEAALRAGMGIGERHPHLDNPSYAASGFDVEFQPEKKDFTFHNSLGIPIMVAITFNGETPIVTFNGTPKADWKAPKITVNKEVFTQDRILLTDFTIPSGGEVKRSDGAPGLLVKVYADVKNDGKNELLYKDYYTPRPVVIARGPTAEELKP